MAPICEQGNFNSNVIVSIRYFRFSIEKKEICNNVSEPMQYHQIPKKKTKKKKNTQGNFYVYATVSASLR